MRKKLPKAFKLYLKTQGVSPVTIKNYLSDFNHFWGWLILTLKSRGNTIPRVGMEQIIVSQITPQIIDEYKAFLLANKTAIKTVNRRLSSLRKFGEFTQVQGWIKENPGKKVSNIHLGGAEVVASSPSEVLNKFKVHLEEEKVSSITVKNYLTDVRDFLAFIEVI